jgi:hypothetical protein
MLGQSSIRLLGVVLGGRASSGAHFLAQQLFLFVLKRKSNQNQLNSKTIEWPGIGLYNKNNLVGRG